MGMLQTTDSEDAQDAEARPSSDPLPASSVDLQDDGQPSSSCWLPEAHFASIVDHTSNAAVAADLHCKHPAPAPAAIHQHAASKDMAHMHEASQPAHAKELQQAQVSRTTSEGALEGLRQPNGHAPQEYSPDRSASMDKDDAALLGDMQGFASALGCDWQVQLHSDVGILACVMSDSQSLMPAFACNL